MGGNTSLHQWGRFCQKQISHQEDPKLVAKLESAWWEVTGRKISSDLVLVQWANQKAYVKNSRKGLCACAEATGDVRRGGSRWLLLWKYFLSICYVVETSGKTRISRTYGLGRLILCAFSFFCLSSYVWFCFVGQDNNKTIWSQLLFFSF